MRGKDNIGIVTHARCFCGWEDRQIVGTVKSALSNA